MITNKTTTTRAHSPTPATMILLSLLLCSFVATTTAGRVQSLPKTCSKPCTSATKIQDCTDNWGRVGTLPSKDASDFLIFSFVISNEALCGNVECIDGFCSMNATRKYLGVFCGHEHCDNDDAKCDAGPHDLDYEGTCSLWHYSDKAYRDCNYRWCPPEKPIEQDIILPFEPEDPLDWRVPRTCPNGGCTTDADCIDPEGIYGVIPPVPGVTPESVYIPHQKYAHPMNSACGKASCRTDSGMCTLKPLQEDKPKYECGFLTTNCTSDGQCQGAAPAYPMFKYGYCPVYHPFPRHPPNIPFVPGPRICQYYWCPPSPNVASTTTITTSAATTVADTTTTATTATRITSTTATTTNPATATTTPAAATTTTIAAATTTIATTATTSTNTLTQSTSTSGDITQTCCNDASDCVADPGKTSLASCGEVRCQNNRCIFNAYNDSEQCGNEYFVWCDGKHDLCVKGPRGSAGQCTHYHNQECLYEWCPGPRTTATELTMTTSKPVINTTKSETTTISSAVVVPPGKICCIDSSDCVADTGKTSLASCGEVKCQNNRCVFDAYIDSGKCGKEYFVWCEGKHELCVKGPGGSAGRCTIFDDQECSYEWCPGLKQDS